MTLTAQDPFAQFSFVLDPGTGTVQAGFEEVTGLSAGQTSKAVTLRRGVFRAQAFEEWRRTLRAGTDRVVIIRLRNEAQTSSTSWKVISPRIIKYTSAPLNATGTDVAMEELVLGYDRLESA
jgi:phage tail-like protein